MSEETSQVTIVLSAAAHERLKREAVRNDRSAAREGKAIVEKYFADTPEEPLPPAPPTPVSRIRSPKKSLPPGYRPPRNPRKGWEPPKKKGSR